MSRYIDADVLLAQVIKKKPEVAKARWTEGFNDAIMRVRSMIHSAPTADVVEVVRCKECKYLYCISAIDRKFYCRHTPKGLSGINIIEDNPYCSYGERREQ